MFYRKTDQGKCDCKLIYEGDEDFILRIGGSSEVKNKNRSVHLITYSLLFDFTLDFFENGTTTRSSWLNCALRDDEAVHWVSIGYCEALAIGN